MAITFDPPNLTISGFSETRRVGGPKRGTDQCAHGHHLKYHIPTAGMYEFRELKGIRHGKLWHKGSRRGLTGFDTPGARVIMIFMTR